MAEPTDEDLALFGLDRQQYDGLDEESKNVIKNRSGFYQNARELVPKLKLFIVLYGELGDRGRELLNPVYLGENAKGVKIMQALTDEYREVGGDPKEFLLKKTNGKIREVFIKTLSK